MTIEEVRVLASCIPKRGNSQVRQAFLFSCFTGLRFSDVKKLTYEEIQGDHLIFPSSKDYAQDCSRSITGGCKYHHQKRAQASQDDKVFWGLPSSQVVNVYLKFWGLEAGIKKSLHFHASRHTFATPLEERMAQIRSTFTGLSEVESVKLRWF